MLIFLLTCEGIGQSAVEYRHITGSSEEHLGETNWNPVIPLIHLAKGKPTLLTVEDHAHLYLANAGIADEFGLRSPGERGFSKNYKAELTKMQT